MVAFCKAKSRFYDKVNPIFPYYCISVVKQAAYRYHGNSISSISTK